MSSKRRAKYDIYADMIEVIAKKGMCSLTLLSYGANLPLDRAKKMLQLLVSHGFVNEVHLDGSRKYRASKRGLEFLETYEKMKKFFAGLEQPVTAVSVDSSAPGRLPTGLTELDSLLLGGIPENYSVVLTSPSCNERQMLVEGFLREGLKNGGVALDITTEIRRSTQMLAEKYQANFHLFVCNPQAGDLIGNLSNVSNLKGVENLTQISIALASVLRSMNRTDNGSKRICVEVVSDVLLHHHALDTRRWLIGLTTDLKSRGFTTLALINPFMHNPAEVQAILDLFEGEIDIYEKESAEGMARYLKVRKMYDQEYVERGVPIKSRKGSTAKSAD